MAPTSEQAKAAKAKVLAGGKAPKAKVARYLKTTESQLNETQKSTLLLKGIKCSQEMSDFLRELRSIQAPNVKLLSKKNPIFVFDEHYGSGSGSMSIEFLTTKNDCALFGLASHNKKRPNNFIIGRTFNHQVLDMVELGIVRFKSMKDHNYNQESAVPKKRIGSKPMLLFVGDLWTSTDSTYSKLQNLLIDFYRGDVVDKLVLSGLDHVIVFNISQTESQQQNTNPNVNGDKNCDYSVIIHQRTYYCKLKKNPNASGERVVNEEGDPLPPPPVPHLSPCGPDIDFVIRREQYAAKDLWDESIKTSKTGKKKKRKNKKTNLFGETMGKLHMKKQNFDSISGKKSKALKRADKIEKLKADETTEMEFDRENEEFQTEFKHNFGFNDKDKES